MKHSNLKVFAQETHAFEDVAMVNLDLLLWGSKRRLRAALSP